MTVIKQTGDANDNQSNELYKFTIAGSGINVSGHMMNELSIGGRNGFTSVASVIGELADTASSISGTAGKVIQAVKSVKSGLDAVAQASSRSKVTDFESRAIWQDSEKPSFSISYKFYNSSQEIAVSNKGALSMALALQSSVLPTKGKPAKGREGVFFRSPLGYKPKTSKQAVASGTLTLSIGKWFRATDLIVTSTNFTPSVQIMGNGHPLYVSGSITLEPSELITYQTFLGYFRNISVNQGETELTGLL